MYSAIYDKERPRPTQQFPNDAFARALVPARQSAGGCDPYSQDCGGYRALQHVQGLPGHGARRSACRTLARTSTRVAPAASPEDWPVVPFRREWLGTDYPGGNSPEAAIKRLLRFTLLDRQLRLGRARRTRAYTLDEDAKEVAVTAPGTPLAGALLDAYNYFVNSVFPTPTEAAPPDPAIDCRNYIIVFVTDGHDECWLRIRASAA